MSKPKLDRNLEIVKLRNKDPKKWSIEALRKKYKFKSKATVHEILQTFTPKFKGMLVETPNAKR